MHKYFYFQLGATLFLCLCSISSFGQTLSAYEKAANDAFLKKDYYNAVHYYELVLKSKKTAAISYQYAQACRLSYAYKKAENAYLEIIQGREGQNYPKASFYYALVLKHNGKYAAASKEFNHYIRYHPQENYFRKKALQEIEACRWAKDAINHPVDTINIERLGDKVNTKYSDFGAHWVGDRLYYSSLRFELEPNKEQRKNSRKDKTQRLVAKLLQTPSYDKKKGEILETLNKKDCHTSNSALSPDGSRLYFTYCSGMNSDSVICDLYLSLKKADGSSWSNPTKLPSPVNLEKYSSSQPSVGFDKTLDKEVLYFSSDRPGGEGKNDIWFVVIHDNETYGIPENLGSVINTIEDEISPFFHTPTQALYFSSEWHKGFGGFDIFRSERDGKLWLAPLNLGIPVNSAANDVYYLINEGDSTGFFASNREGSKAITGESCCNDIYRYSMSSPAFLDTPIVFMDSFPPDTSTIVQVDSPKDIPVALVDSPKNPTIPPNLTPDTIPTVEELNKMLPLSLYFHNDEPDSNTRATTTDKPYSLTYNEYISLKNDYKMHHATQVGAEAQPMISRKIDDFFENEVRGEYERMNVFYTKALELLEGGVKMEVYIKGYTSPRSNDAYNKALAKRRIVSVRKEFFSYQNGALLKYFEKGQLAVREMPLGESTAPSGISDSIDDPRNSIYSVEASRERKVEITLVQAKK